MWLEKMEYKLKGFIHNLTQLLYPCRYSFASTVNSVDFWFSSKNPLLSVPKEVYMLLLKISWQLLSPSGPSLLKLHGPCPVLRFSWQSHFITDEVPKDLICTTSIISLSLKTTNKKAGRKKSIDYLIRKWDYCYFIHLWDFIIIFNAIINLAFSKHILVFHSRSYPGKAKEFCTFA